MEEKMPVQPTQEDIAKLFGDSFETMAEEIEKQKKRLANALLMYAIIGAIVVFALGFTAGALIF